jgi:hypothetical protein
VKEAVGIVLVVGLIALWLDQEWTHWVEHWNARRDRKRRVREIIERQPLRPNG